MFATFLQLSGRKKIKNRKEADTQKPGKLSETSVQKGKVSERGTAPFM